MYASGKIAASEVSAFRAVVHFRQAVTAQGMKFGNFVSTRV